MEEPFFFLEIDFSHERYIVSSLAHMVSPGSYHILIGQISIKHGLNSRKRLPPVSDHLNLNFWVVAGWLLTGGSTVVC